MPEIFLLVESGWVLQSGIPLTTVGIRNPSSTDKESRIQYLESGVHIPRLWWTTMYGASPCLPDRLHDEVGRKLRLTAFFSFSFKAWNLKAGISEDFLFWVRRGCPKRIKRKPWETKKTHGHWKFKTIKTNLITTSWNVLFFAHTPSLIVRSFWVSRAKNEGKRKMYDK